jgi:hypothetical protein
MLTPAMALPRKLAAGENQPLMFTVDVPAGIAAGDYKGVVTITWRENGAEKSANIPYTVKVWNFELPKHLSYRAFGVNWSACGMPAAKLLARYHYNIGTPNLTANGVEMRRPSQGFRDNFTKMNLPNFFDAARELTNEYNCNVVTIPFTFCGNCMWTTGGVFYNSCYMTVTYEKITLFKNKRAKDRGEQPMVTIFCNTIRAIRMSGNMQGPYMILTMTDGKSLNFRYLFAMQEIHNACQKAARSHNPQWFQY